MNKRLVVLIGLGVISFVGAVQLIEFKKHGPAGQSATGNQNSLGLKQTNSDSLPPGTPLALLEKIPPVYKLWDDDDSTTNTRLLAVDGSDTLGTEGRLRAMHAISDSESETLAIVVVSKELAVPWTQPIDFTLRADLFPQQMQKIGRDEFVFTTVQGAALTFPARGQFATFEALATIGGGEANAIDAMIKEK